MEVNGNFDEKNLVGELKDRMGAARLGWGRLLSGGNSTPRGSNVITLICIVDQRRAPRSQCL